MSPQVANNKHVVSCHEPEIPPDSSITSLMRYNRFSQLSRDRALKIKNASVTKPKKVTELRKCLILNPTKKQQINDENQIQKLCEFAEGRSEVNIKKEELIKFTKKFAVVKADLQETIKKLQEEVTEKTLLTKQLEAKNKLYEAQIRKLNEQLAQSFQKYELKISEISAQQAAKKQEILSLNHELIKSKMKLEEQALEGKRCKEFLKIKNEIIANLEWELKNKGVQCGIKKKKSEYSIFEDGQRFRAVSLENSLKKAQSSRQNSSRVSPKVKRIVIKKTQKEPITHRPSQYTKKASIPDLKQCEDIGTKLQGLIGAVRDRDIRIEELKSQNEKLKKSINSQMSKNKKVRESVECSEFS